jgi:integrase
MARKKFTAITLQGMTTGKEVADSECPGLRAKRYPKTGKVSFLLRYRRPGSRRGAKIVLGWLDTHGGEEGEATIGGPLSLSQARFLCAQCRRDLARGIDPGKVKQDRMHEERLKAQDTFDKVARDYCQRRQRDLRRWKGTCMTLGYTVQKDGTLGEKPRKGSPAEKWQNTAVHDISKRDVQRLTDAKLDAGHGYGALALFKSLRRFFNHCVERLILDASPLQGIKPPFRGASRDRTLSPIELRCFWKATATGDVYSLLLRHLLLTAARRDEGRYMTHAELTPDGLTWNLSGVRTKNKNAHSIPLSKLARESLATAPRVMLPNGKPSPWVFSLGGAKALAGLSKLKRKVDERMLAALRAETGDESVELQNWRTHDLRRTACTLVAECGFPQEVCEKLLNHTSGKFASVAGVYNRFNYAPQVRQAVDALAARVLAIVEGKDNVIPMRKVG